jgi:SAM-dependent methyltransferase
MSARTDRLWDDPARDYRRRYRLPDQFTWDAAAWPRIDFDGYTGLAFDLLPPSPGRVLDVGCGPGAGSLRLSERGYDVVGVDYNERAVAFARILAEGGTFVQGDIRALGAIDDPAVGDGFDAAVCIEVLEHVPPEFRSGVFEGVFGRLRPSGTFVLTTPARQMSANAWDYARPTRDELVEMLADAGFDDVEVRFQHRLGTAFDPRVWRLFSNRWIDVRVLRHLVRRLFLARWNRVSDPERAGRSIVSARRP